LLLIIQDREFIFGEVLAEPDHAYRQHGEKPYRTSSSLPAQLARALVTQTLIAVNTGASINGRLLAGTAVTLQQNPITQPAP
jgi:hypothetical protein